MVLVVIEIVIGTVAGITWTQRDDGYDHTHNTNHGYCPSIKTDDDNV